MLALPIDILFGSVPLDEHLVLRHWSKLATHYQTRYRKLPTCASWFWSLTQPAAFDIPDRRTYKARQPRRTVCGPRSMCAFGVLR
ncbi:MAG TPA: hypothetical protein VJN18_20845 [Polyangiaceae bacterium]|nr:hypothetical protein [Polyangiaceae bacterium]